jgi:hypothetical protein
MADKKSKNQPLYRWLQGQLTLYYKKQDGGKVSLFDEREANLGEDLGKPLTSNKQQL